MQSWKPDKTYDSEAEHLERSLQAALPAYEIAVGRSSSIIPDDDPTFMEYQKRKFTVRFIQDRYGVDMPVSRELVRHEPIAKVIAVVLPAVRHMFTNR